MSLFKVKILQKAILLILIGCISSTAKSTPTSSSRQQVEGDDNFQVIGDHITLHVNKKDSPQQSQKIPKPVRSELKLPDESILLERSALIQALKERFSQHADRVRTVVLAGVVGMGGVGKTTLARMWGRQYGQEHPNSTIWEVNAETQISLSNSFRALSTALAQIPQQKEELNHIDNVKNIEEQEKQRLQFVKSCLKEQNGWLLIFDNVESYKDIKHYLPQDPMIWGKGQVVITTRNIHLREGEFIQSDSMVNLEELSHEDALRLFTRIRFKCEPEQLLAEERSKAADCLKKIPPFPLDISTAARYMRHYQLSYDEYQKQLKEQSKEFSNHQETLLKEVSDYTKTRYGIITLALKRIIKSNKEFTGLLLMTSLLDSQNIPTELLDHLHTSSTTLQFLDELRKHSLIISENKIQDFRTFSIHKSTQDVCGAFLAESLQQKPGKSLVSSVICALESYVNRYVNNEDFFAMKLFVRHLEKLSRSKYLSEVDIGRVKVLLGCVLSNIGGNLSTVQKLLEDFIFKINDTPAVNRYRVAQALTFLGHLYHELGETKKAISLLERAIQLYGGRRKGSIEASRPLMYLGNTYRFEGKYQKAKKVLIECIDNLEKNDKNHIMLAQSLAYLGVVYRYLGDYRNALSLLQKSLTILTQHNKTPTWMLWVSLQIGSVLTDLGQYIEAKKILNNGLEKSREIYGESSLYTGWALANLGRLDMECRNNQAAFSRLEKSKLMFEEKNTENHIYFDLILGCLANLYTQYENYSEASTILKKSLILFEKYYGTKHLRIAKVTRHFGEFYLKHGDINKAESFIQESLHILQNNSEAPNHPNQHWSYEILATVYERRAEMAMKDNQLKDATKYKQQAKNYLNDALVTAESHFPKESEHIRRIRLRLDQID